MIRYFILASDSSRHSYTQNKSSRQIEEAHARQCGSVVEYFLGKPLNVQTPRIVRHRSQHLKRDFRFVVDLRCVQAHRQRSSEQKYQRKPKVKCMGKRRHRSKRVAGGCVGEKEKRKHLVNSECAFRSGQGAPVLTSNYATIVRR